MGHKQKKCNVYGDELRMNEYEITRRTHKINLMVDVGDISMLN